MPAHSAIVGRHHLKRRCFLGRIYHGIAEIVAKGQPCKIAATSRVSRAPGVGPFLNRADSIATGQGGA